MTRTVGPPQARSLDPFDLAREARRVAGTDPDQPLNFTDALSRLTTALDAEARLTDAGRARAHAALVAALVTQLQVSRMTVWLPETPMPRPVFIAGLLRTGTTFLQNLLTQHPGLRVPRLWELMYPADPRARDELVRDCERYVAEYYRAAPGFRAIHHLDPHLGEECHRLTGNTFRHFIYGLRYRVPSYLSWLDQVSMAPGYAYHRTQLRCLLARDTREPDRPVVLKCPSHLWHLDDLARVYPDATVIRLHRDPAVAIPSVCSLTATVRAARSGRVDPVEIGQEWLKRADAVLPRLRRGAGATAKPPLDLRYADLVADPIGVVGQVCEHIGVPLTAEARTRITDYLAAGAGKPAGRHTYQPETFGLRTGELTERFADYLAEFDLQPESKGGHRDHNR